MKKIICKKEYDTENAQLIKKYVNGFYGDPKGYEEILFCTPDGFYFQYARGGEESIHPTEEITRIAKNKVDAWLESH